VIHLGVSSWIMHDDAMKETWLQELTQWHGKALFSFQKILQNFLHSPSHRIFRHMHEVLNIDKNKN